MKIKTIIFWLVYILTLTLLAYMGYGIRNWEYWTMIILILIIKDTK